MTNPAKETRRVAVYARVSTNGYGKHDGQTTDTQLAELRRHCEYKRWQIVEEYVDQGVSGSKISRPALNRLLADAKEKKFDIVLIWRFDRFGRSTKHLLDCLETFKKLKIDFVSMTEQLDTTTVHGEMVFTILAAIAQMERRLVGERVKAKLHYIKEHEGRVPGPGRKIKITVAEIQQRRRQKESLYDIARDVGCTPQLLHARLKRG